MLVGRLGNVSRGQHDRHLFLDGIKKETAASSTRSKAVPEKNEPEKEPREKDKDIDTDKDCREPADKKIRIDRRGAADDSSLVMSRSVAVTLEQQAPCRIGQQLLSDGQEAVYRGLDVKLVYRIGQTILAQCHAQLPGSIDAGALILCEQATLLTLKSTLKPRPDGSIWTLSLLVPKTDRDLVVAHKDLLRIKVCYDRVLASPDSTLADKLLAYENLGNAFLTLANACQEAALAYAKRTEEAAQKAEAIAKETHLTPEVEAWAVSTAAVLYKPGSDWVKFLTLMAELKGVGKEIPPAAEMILTVVKSVKASLSEIINIKIFYTAERQFALAFRHMELVAKMEADGVVELVDVKDRRLAQIDLTFLRRILIELWHVFMSRPDFLLLAYQF